MKLPTLKTSRPFPDFNGHGGPSELFAVIICGLAASGLVTALAFCAYSSGLLAPWLAATGEAVNLLLSVAA